MLLAFLFVAAVSAPVAPRTPADFALLQGRVLITTRAADAVAIAVDTDDDGALDDLFWFYSEHAPSLRIVAEKAAVEFRGDELAVISAEGGATYVFAVGKPRIAVRRLDDGPRTGSAAYSGFGLEHKMGSAVNAIRPFSSGTGRLRPENEGCVGGDDCVLVPDSGDGGGGSSCEQGGTGASSCSVTSGDQSCSVTCTSGYHACCNATLLPRVSCKCVEQ